MSIFLTVYAPLRISNSMHLYESQIALRWQVNTCHLHNATSVFHGSWLLLLARNPIALVLSADPADVNSERNRCIAELQDTAPLQAQSALQFWLDRESSYHRLSPLASWRWILCHPRPHRRLFSLRGKLTARKRNRTRLSIPSIDVCFWNLTVISCIELLNYCVKCEVADC